MKIERQDAFSVIARSMQQGRRRVSKALMHPEVLMLATIFLTTAANAMPGPSQMMKSGNQKSAKKKKEVPEKGPMRACLVVSIYVPHNNNAIDNFIAYPYPFPPPLEMSAFKTDLPTDSSKVEQLLKDELSARDWLIDGAFLKRGAFMQDAFLRALRDCKLPLSGKFDQGWLEQVTAPFKLHLMQSNQREEERKQRYKEIADFATDQGEAIKEKSEAAGLCPIRIPVTQLRHSLWQGCNWLGEGSWWLVGTHKLPNLLYYWQVKVTVPQDAAFESGDAQYLQLTDQNAAAIEEN